MEEKQDAKLEHWDKFYASDRLNKPSDFAKSISGYIGTKYAIVDIGCGNGRDSTYFNSIGHHVVGLDYSQAAIDCCNRIYAPSPEPLDFHHGSCGGLDSIIRPLNEDPGLVATYCRFLIHAITDDEEHGLLESLITLNSSSPMFFEFRTSDNRNESKVHGDHFRRYVKVMDFCRRLTSTTGAKIQELSTGHGMAKYKNEDPHIARVFATKR